MITKLATQAALSALLLTLCTPTPADTFTAQFENDLWGSGSDQHYTHGSRFSWVTENRIGPVSTLASKVPWMPSLDPQTQEIRFSLSLGQNIFTPEDITEPALIEDDRPYAGWLYLAGGVILRQDKGTHRQLDAVELSLGVVGPSSHSDDVQREVHKLIDSPRPQGWQHQLQNEPGFIVQYDRQWQFATNALSLEVDSIPHLGGALGNVYTYLSSGITFRLGQNLNMDFGPPLIRPNLPGSGYFEYQHRAWGWYLFAGIDGRALARNIFIDGNSFKSSHRVKREPYVLDAQFGAVLMVSKVRISFTNVFRSKEFIGQQTPSEFGALSLSMQF